MAAAAATMANERRCATTRMQAARALRRHVARPPILFSDADGGGGER